MFSMIFFSEEILHRKGQIYQEYRQNMTIQTQTYEADRENLVESGCLIMSRVGELMQKQLRVTFRDEEGLGEGPVKEFFTLLSKPSRKTSASSF